MLFSSYEFVFLFLPAVIIVFYAPFLRNRLRPRLAVLLVASLFFYAWWDIRFLPLLLGSIAGNFLIGLVIGSHAADGLAQRNWLFAGVVFNMIVLGFFKYWNFSLTA